MLKMYSTDVQTGRTEETKEYKERLEKGETLAKNLTEAESDE